MSTATIAKRDDMMALDIADPRSIAEVFAKSGFFQDARDVAQCAVKLIAGRELGIPAIAAMTGIYLVKGRITLSANLMATLIKRSGRYNYRVRRLDSEACAIDFFEDGQVVGESVFTIEDAVTAGIAHGDNWKHYPRNMLFARALSNGAKWYCPDLFAGPVYTPDELGGQVDAVSGEPVGDPREVEVLAGMRAETGAPAPDHVETIVREHRRERLLQNWRAAVDMAERAGLSVPPADLSEAGETEIAAAGQRVKEALRRAKAAGWTAAFINARRRGLDPARLPCDTDPDDLVEAASALQERLEDLNAGA
jgi:hypothetical protein